MNSCVLAFLERRENANRASVASVASVPPPTSSACMRHSLLFLVRMRDGRDFCFTAGVTAGAMEPSPLAASTALRSLLASRSCDRCCQTVVRYASSSWYASAPPAPHRLHVRSPRGNPARPPTSPTSTSPTSYGRQCCCPHTCLSCPANLPLAHCLTNGCGTSRFSNPRTCSSDRQLRSS